MKEGKRLVVRSTVKENMMMEMDRVLRL